VAKRHRYTRLTQSVGRRHRTTPELVSNKANTLTHERRAQRKAEPNKWGDRRQAAKEWRGGEPPDRSEDAFHGCCCVGEAPRNTLLDRTRWNPGDVETDVERGNASGRNQDLLDTAAAGPAAIRGTALRLVGYGISVVVGVGAMALLFRHLGVDDGGRYVTIIALVGLFGGVTDAGLATIAVRELTVRFGEDRDAVFRSLLGLRVVTALAGAGLATLFAAAVGYDPILVLGTVLAGIGFALQSIQLTLAAPLMKNMRLGWVAALDALRWIAFALLVIALVELGASLLSFFSVTIPVGILVLGLTAWLIRDGRLLLPSFRTDPWRGLVREALPFTIAIAVASIYFKVALILVSLLSTAE
jgi:hypothetical protein